MSVPRFLMRRSRTGGKHGIPPHANQAEAPIPVVEAPVVEAPVVVVVEPVVVVVVEAPIPVVEAPVETPIPVVVVEAPVVDVVEEKAPVADWDPKMKKAELLAIAQAKGLNVSDASSKADIVAALEAGKA